MDKNVSESTRDSLFNDSMWVVSQTINNAIAVRMALFSVSDPTTTRLRELRDEIGQIRDAATQKLLAGLERITANSN